MRYDKAANTEKLLNLFNEMKSGLLNSRPSFQRNLVWSNKHKENFIETILKGYPFPEIYLCEGETDVELKKSTRLVVDGQQRLDTICRYIMGELKCRKIQSFAELSEPQKEEFYKYKIVVRDLEKIEDKEIREIFNRINSIQYALNAMEIRNALYEGEFISTAQDIAERKELEKLEIFSETQYARMKNADFILIVMTTIEVGGYFSRDNEVGNLITTYDPNYSNKNKIKKDIIGVLQLINKADLPFDSIWLRKSSFFTLVVELIKYKRERGELPSSKSLKKTLSKLEKLIEENKSGDIDKNQYARYYNYVYQATASKTGRIARGEVLKRHLEKSENA